MNAINRASRFSIGAIVAVFVMTAGGIGAATAQQTQTPTVSAFLANPGQLLQQNPNGGPILISTVQQLALADPATFKALLGLLAAPAINDAQKSAIGAGLAQAAKIEVLTDQALAADWQQQIGAITDTSFKTAATNAFGDVQLGGTGGGPLGGTGGGGGQTDPISQTSAGSGPAQNLQSTPVGTPNFTMSSSVSAANSVPGSNSSVSP